MGGDIVQSGEKIISMARIAQLKELLLKIDFPYALIKGDALSVQMYGCPGKREYGDIDLLIDRKNLKKIKVALQECGYKCDSNNDRSAEIILLSYSHQSFPWYKDNYYWGRLEIDLNHDIFWGEYEGERIDINEFLSNTVSMNIYGVTVNTLTPSKAFIQLALHHYKDMNSIFILATRKTICYHKFYEIWRLLKNNINCISVEDLYIECQKYNAVPYIYFVLYYTNLLFDDDSLISFVDAFKTDEGESLINCYGLSSKERREWKIDFFSRLSSNGCQISENLLSSEDKQKIDVNINFLGFGK